MLVLKMEPLDPAVNPCYNADGVDVSLIRWMLSLTARERLEILEDHANDIVAIRERNART